MARYSRGKWRLSRDECDHLVDSLERGDLEYLVKSGEVRLEEEDRIRDELRDE